MKKSLPFTVAFNNKIFRKKFNKIYARSVHSKTINYGGKK